MLKGELEILSAIALNKHTRKQISNSHIARNNQFIISTIDSLLRDGYIIKIHPIGYQLTLKGFETLVELLPNNSINNYSMVYRLLHDRIIRTNEAVKLIETLSSEVIKKLEEL
ncbi:MAG: hypothetical protein FK734_11070 [Asgard group archaeon]|nr:hypothetical protein [Asgard group archaeon]